MADTFEHDLESVIERQLGDHPRTGDVAVILVLLYIAEAIVWAARRICAACGRE
jgi:hypothetical protein